MPHLSLWHVAALSISAMISVVNATGELLRSSRVLAGLTCTQLLPCTSEAAARF
jgi:hypothetical protein